MFRLVLIAGVCCGAGALAQSNPDEEWGDFPLAPPPPFPPPAMIPPPARLAPPPPVPGSAPRAGLGASTRPPVEPNTVSMFGAPTLGQWKRGQALFLGFPLLGLKLSLGLLDRLDFSVGFESFYGVMNEFHTGFKVGISRGSNWSISASVEGMLALFAQRASKEIHGPRWITGHRNYGVSPGVLVSYQGDSPRAARLFLDARYLLAFDTEPFARAPLSGVPPGLILGHNVQFRFGAEIPLSSRTSFVFLLGLE
ncbi:MAG: hypothetical protein H6Q89_4315, partial [Myxococcaceae bacterium]|nr:hypothetical protein [Myxococcaceae bacterium]